MATVIILCHKVENPLSAASDRPTVPLKHYIFLHEMINFMELKKAGDMCYQ